MIVSPFETPEPYSTELVHGHLDFRIAPGPTCSFIFSGDSSALTETEGAGSWKELEAEGAKRTKTERA